LEQAGKTGRLVLSARKLSGFPAEVWSIGLRLRSLDVSHNNLRVLPSQIGTLSKLQTLKLSHNLLVGLPDEFHHLENLKVLEADHNLIQSVRGTLPRKNLRTLDLSYNALEGVVGHPGLALPPSVVSCNLGHNKISALDPVAFGFQTLPKLEELDLDNNMIELLPPDIGQLEKLTTLKARNNKLSTLPSELLRDTPVNRMHLEGNPVTLSHLKTVEGFADFLERRKLRISKGWNQGLHPELDICGLGES